MSDLRKLRYGYRKEPEENQSMPVERASPPIVNKANGDHISCCRPKTPFARGTVFVEFVLSRIYPRVFRIPKK